MQSNVRTLWSTVLAIIVAGCSGSTPSAAPSATTSTPTVAVTLAPTPSATAPAPADAAPVELQGDWYTTMAPGDVVTLTLRDTTYRIVRGGFTGLGHIAVTGDAIEFSKANECKEGAGTYRWSITNATLTFTQVGGPDPCPRHEVLLGHDYVRSGS
jgi:hypothetical protein